VKEVIAFTDGACSGNPGIGGWAYILKYGEHTKEDWGCVLHTTNNRMELTAIIEALKALKEPCKVTLYTDSRYCYDGFTKWLEMWVKCGWKKSDKKEVKNKDLWKFLLDLSRLHKINMIWINAYHNESLNSFPENDRVDKLAKKAIKDCS